MNTLEIIRGDDETITVTFKDAAGTVINITGYTVYFTVKSNLNMTDADAEIKKDITNHSDPTHGKTQIDLTSTDTAIASGVYYWDLQLKNSQGEISSTEKGEFKIVQDVTTR